MHIISHQRNLVVSGSINAPLQVTRASHVTINGSSNAPISINGASYVTINGSNNAPLQIYGDSHLVINGSNNARVQVIGNSQVFINGSVNAPLQFIASDSYIALSDTTKYITQAEMDQLDAQLSRHRRPLPPPVPEVCIGETNQYFHKNENNERGFEVGVRFATKNHKNSPCTVAVYFYDSGGNPLRDIDGTACCKFGNIAVYKNVMPQHAECEFKDFRVFVPLRQLHLQMGKRHDLAHQVFTWNGDKETSRSKLKTFYIDT